MAWSAAPNLACCAGDALRDRTSGSTAAAAAAAAAINVALPMQRTCAMAVASTSGSSCFQDNLHELRLLSSRGSRRRRMAAALRLGQRQQQVFLTTANAAGGYASAGHGGTGRSRGSDCDEEQYNGPNYDYYDDAASKSSSTPLLDRIHCPAHLKKLNARELAQLSDELRHETVSRVAPGAGSGHPPVPVDSSLAVVELTVALHHVFDAPRDRIVWDVGHQTIPHKILTGRRGRIHTMAQPGGLSGFTCRSESEFDAFGAGHSAAAVSAGLGMAVGRDLKGRDNHVVAVIGDGAMTAGQAFEAMSNAGYLEANMVVIFNDSRRPPDSSSSSSSCCLQSMLGGGGGDGVDAPVPPPSPICPALSRLQASKPLRELREVAKNVTKQLSDTVHGLAARVDDVARGLLSGPASSFFDGLGMYYIGPVDGHNVQHLVTILSEVKATQTDGPVIIHIVTEQGRGRPAATAAAEGSDDRAGASAAPVHVRNTPTAATDSSSSSVSYSTLFADALADQAAVDPDIVAIHAAMARGTGLDIFGARFPDRVFDVGVAEQHAVTFAAGLACEGLKPFCAISSSCLQRAYDQVIHDVAQQRLPVRFAVSDAGLAGAGALDVTYMACLPSMVVMAPADGAELACMVATAAALDDRPSCLRFPRGYASSSSSSPPWNSSTIEVGRGRVLVEGSQVALLAYGATVPSCLAAQSVLAQRHGVSVTVADARFCKPLDRALIRRLAREHQALVTVEEGAIGGFGSHVAQFLALDGLLDGHLRWRPLLLPDCCYHLHQGSHHQQLAQAGLTVEHIAATVLTLLGKKKDALQHIFSCSSPSSSSSRF